MELSVTVVTRPLPGICAKVIIIIVTVLVTWRTGYGPATVIPLLLGAGLTGTRIAHSLPSHSGRRSS